MGPIIAPSAAFGKNPILHVDIIRAILYCKIDVIGGSTKCLPVHVLWGLARSMQRYCVGRTMLNVLYLALRSLFCENNGFCFRPAFAFAEVLLGRIFKL